MPTRARIRGLILLVVANASLLALILAVVSISLPSLLPYLRGGSFYSLTLGWLHDGTESVLLGQMLILGYIVALGGASLPRRLVVASISVGLVYSILVIHRIAISGGFENSFWTSLDDWAKYGGVVIVSCLLLRALRPWRGWRLQWDDSPPRVVSRQFGIVHLLAWTTAIAFPLGILQTVFGQRRLQLVAEVLILLVWSLPVSVPAFCWAIRHGKARRKWFWLTILSVALVSLWPILFFGYSYLTSGRGALPPWWAFPLLMAKTFTTFMVLFLVLVGNVFWMERLGLRIRKPVSRAAGAPALIGVANVPPA